ncbi:MAG: NAD(P)H-hydrate epimerase [Bacteroidales bacterium]
MKILTVDQIAEADAYTIKHEPVASVDLMERAGNNCFQWIYERLTPGYKIMVYTGVGNNGGDGMVIARLLAEKDVDTQVIVLKFSDKLSEDAQRNLDLLYKQKKVSVKIVTEEQYIPAPGSGTLVVDAIFGSGLGRPVRGLPGKAIEKINRSEALVVAVDIPSGMYADKYTDENEGKVIHATYTLSLQMPKLAMMMPESARFVGEMHVIPIGLHPGYLNSVDATYQRLDEKYENCHYIRHT